MKPGDKVACIDDEGWLIPDAGPAPRKGSAYVIRELAYFRAIAAVSLLGFPANQLFQGVPVSTTDA